MHVLVTLKHNLAAPVDLSLSHGTLTLHLRVHPVFPCQRIKQRDRLMLMSFASSVDSVVLYIGLLRDVCTN